VLYFFDTSALVKRYHEEPGTQTVVECFRDPHNLLLICNLSIAELIAALHKLERQGRLPHEAVEAARGQLMLDLLSAKLGVVDVQRHHVFEAETLILQHSLSANDAIILACLLEARAQQPVFVCADTRSGLLRAAEAHGLSTLNPLTPAP
jgi:predicted nucleic acid-binding protein